MAKRRITFSCKLLTCDLNVMLSTYNRIALYFLNHFVKVCKKSMVTYCWVLTHIFRKKKLYCLSLSIILVILYHLALHFGKINFQWKYKIVYYINQFSGQFNITTIRLHSVCWVTNHVCYEFCLLTNFAAIFNLFCSNLLSW